MYEIRSVKKAGSIHEVLFWILLLLLIIALMLYGALIGFRMIDVDILGEDPNFAIPVLLTVALVFLSATARLFVIRIQDG